MIRKLFRRWVERADALELKGKARDEDLLSFFLGAAMLSEEVSGDGHPTSVRLMKACIYVISVRGEKGMAAHVESNP